MSCRRVVVEPRGKAVPSEQTGHDVGGGGGGLSILFSRPPPPFQRRRNFHDDAALFLADIRLVRSCSAKAFARHMQGIGGICQRRPIVTHVHTSDGVAQGRCGEETRDLLCREAGFRALRQSGRCVCARMSECPRPWKPQRCGLAERFINAYDQCAIKSIGILRGMTENGMHKKIPNCSFVTLDPGRSMA